MLILFILQIFTSFASGPEIGWLVNECLHRLHLFTWMASCKIWSSTSPGKNRRSYDTSQVRNTLALWRALTRCATSHNHLKKLSLTNPTERTGELANCSHIHRLKGEFAHSFHHNHAWELAGYVHAILCSFNWLPGNSSRLWDCVCLNMWVRLLRGSNDEYRIPSITLMRLLRRLIARQDSFRGRLMYIWDPDLWHLFNWNAFIVCDRETKRERLVRNPGRPNQISGK